MTEGLESIFSDAATRENCHIYRMLVEQAQREHLSFHTPGHKQAQWDITELRYSDNLSCPSGCIAAAQRDIAALLGAERSYILTDGSTSGVLAMLYAAKLHGVQKLAVSEGAHKSVYNGCKLLDLTPLVYPRGYRQKIPFEPTMSALNAAYPDIFKQADALLFTSPDYYGNFADLQGAKEFCSRENKLLLVDGAHGGHLREDARHARFYADMWVDGVHKSLPALTQGAVVSAAKGFGERLGEGVEIFRTTSPSYPIMASVEYAVKYPRNVALEKRVEAYKTHPRIYQNGDWTKLCARFGKWAFDAENALINSGIYPEFCDGNVVAFYLSPAVKTQDFERLTAALETLFSKYPLEEEKQEKNTVERVPAPLVFDNTETEWVEISRAEGRICAQMCGLFPPCSPLFFVGDRICAEKLDLFNKASNVFGLKDGKICVKKQ